MGALSLDETGPVQWVDQHAVGIGVGLAIVLAGATLFRRVRRRARRAGTASASGSSVPLPAPVDALVQQCLRLGAEEGRARAREPAPDVSDDEPPCLNVLPFRRARPRLEYCMGPGEVRTDSVTGRRLAPRTNRA